MGIDAFQAKYAAKLEAAERELRSMTRRVLPLISSQLRPGLLESRIGGNIAWPRAEPIPTDAAGNAMVFAAQFNFAELGGLPNFPATGILQLFLANDVNERGITFIRKYRGDGDFPLQNGDGFRLVYHRDTKDLVETLYELPAAKYPVWTPEIRSEPLGLFSHGAIYHLPPMTHWQGSLIYERLQQLPEAQEMLVEVFDLLEKQVWDNQHPAQFYLGGYANPLQNDHRRFFEEYRKYDSCVLNVGELPGLTFVGINLAIVISDADLRNAQFEDVVMIASMA